MRMNQNLSLLVGRAQSYRVHFHAFVTAKQ